MTDITCYHEENRLMDDKNSMILKFGVLLKNTGHPPKICKVLENIRTKKLQRTRGEQVASK